jgi:hypothetical protein
MASSRRTARSPRGWGDDTGLLDDLLRNGHIGGDVVEPAHD